MILNLCNTLCFGVSKDPFHMLRVICSRVILDWTLVLLTVAPITIFNMSKISVTIY